MAAEARRGCGFRKVGGLYLVCPAVGAFCGRLPLPLTICAACGAGIKQSRGWTWIDPAAVLGDTGALLERSEPCFAQGTLPTYCQSHCPIYDPKQFGEKAGLLWVGEKFYSPATFQLEANKLGVSKRISSVPRRLEIGKTWVLLGHPKAIVEPGRCQCSHVDVEHNEHDICTAEGCKCDEFSEGTPGIFMVFKPTAIELIVTESQSKDAEFMASVEKRGLKPVVVPDGDPDHNPSSAKPSANRAAKLPSSDSLGLSDSWRLSTPVAHELVETPRCRVLEGLSRQCLHQSSSFGTEPRGQMGGANP